MTYDEAMRRFGSDAPDLRYGMEIVDCSDLAKQSEFRVFRGAVDANGFVRGIKVEGRAEEFSRKRIDELTEFVKHDFAAKGLAWFRVEPDGTLWSPISKNVEAPVLDGFKARFEAKPGDLILLLADSWEITCKGLNGLRRKLAAELKLYDPGQMHFSWVVESQCLIMTLKKIVGWQLTIRLPRRAPRTCRVSVMNLPLAAHKLTIDHQRL